MSGWLWGMQWRFREVEGVEEVEEVEEVWSLILTNKNKYHDRFY
jgi:hypothetical protein